MKDFKKDMSREMNIKTGAFLSLFVVMFGCIILFNILGIDEGYDKGYEQAIEDNIEKQNWEEFKTFSFDVKKEAFWSLIIWEVSNHLYLIYWCLFVILLFFAMRF